MAEPTPRSTGRVLRVILVLSLALNLAIVGLVGGLWWRGASKGPPQGFDMAYGPIGSALSPQDRRAIGRNLLRQGDLPRPRGAGFREDIVAMAEALEAEPFDPEVFEAALEKPGQRLEALQSAARVALVERVVAMSSEDRAAFAMRLRDAPRKRRR